MNIRTRLAILPLLCTISFASYVIAEQTHNKLIEPINLSKIANFMVQESLFEGNNEFSTINGALPNGYFTRNIHYWGDYIYNLQITQPVVMELIKRDDQHKSPWVPGNNPLYSLLGKMDTTPQLFAALPQIERLYTSQGASLYDGASWQIATALLYQYNSQAFPREVLTPDHPRNPLKVIKNQFERMNKMDALANGSIINYGQSQQPIRNRQYTLPLSMQGSARVADEILWNSRYQYLTNYENIVPGKLGKISWADYKVVTAESAWQLLAPLHINTLLSKPSNNMVDITQVLTKLSALQYLQTASGAFLNVANGSLKNPTKTYTATAASLAEQASILAFLNVLEYQLSQHMSVDNQFQQSALNATRIMLHGGKTPAGYTTKGLMQYIKGKIITETATNSAPAANDILWSYLALGAEQIAEWTTKEKPLGLWEKIKQQTAYYDVNNNFIGVSYHQNNTKVMSAELSLSAIMMLDDLLRFYKHDEIIVRKLKEDYQALWNGVKLLLTKNYQNNVGFHNQLPVAYQTRLLTNSLAMLEASVRYNRGDDNEVAYYAQPLPHIASTAWYIMAHYQYNPFIPEGNIINYRTEQPFSPDNPQIVYPEYQITIMNVYKKDKQAEEYDADLIAEWAIADNNPSQWQPWITDPINVGSMSTVTIPTSIIENRSGKIRFLTRDNQDEFQQLACEMTIQQAEFRQLFGKDYPLNMAVAIESVDPNDPSQPGRCFILPELPQ